MNNNLKPIRLAWFTPSPIEVESLSEVFSKTLLPLISSKFEVKVYTDSFAKYQDYPTGHYLTAVLDHQAEPYDLFIYQFENHLSSHFARAHLGLIPGLAIFHHINFVDYGAESFLNSPWSKVIPQLNQDEINWPSRLNKYLPEGPFGRRESVHALQALFTNPQNLTEFQRNLDPCSLSLQYQLKPEHLAFPVNTNFTISYSDNLRLATPARPTIAERVPQILYALRNNPDWKLSWLIEESELQLANSFIQEFKVQSQVDFIFGRTIANWQKLLQDSSVALHLLFSVFEQPCPYLSISMSQGKAIITSDCGYADYLPANLVFKIPTGVGEESYLSNLLKELKNNDRLLYSEQVAEFAKENFSKDLIAKELMELINRNLGAYRKFYKDWHNFNLDAKQSLIREVEGLMNQNSENFPLGFSWEENLKDQFIALGWI